MRGRLVLFSGVAEILSNFSCFFDAQAAGTETPVDKWS
jgi:hypothetical protein